MLSFARASASSSESIGATAVNGANSSSWNRRWLVGRPDDRRLHVEAARQRPVGEPLAAGEHRAVAARLGDRLLVAVDRALVDDRARERGPRQRVAHGQLLGLLDEQPDELVVDRALDVDAAVRGALLPAEAERGAHDPLGRLLEVGAAEHDRGVLAAHLHDARPRPAGRERAEQLEAHLERAREHDAVDARVRLQLVADRVAGAHHEVEHAVGHARVAVRLGDRDGRHRRRRGRLEHDACCRPSSRPPTARRRAPSGS